MMRIALLNLPWRQNRRLGVRAGSRWPFTSLPEKDGLIHYIPFPFFLAYAASLLKKEGRKVKLIDAIAEGLGEECLIEKLNSFKPELIVVESSTPSFKNDLRTIHRIYNALPNCRIAICGPHASVFSKESLEEYDVIDYILVGEYEYTLLDLVNCLENSLDLESILGLAYRRGEEVRINNERPSIDNLDSLPWPEREDVPIYKYNDGFASLPSPNVQMWTTRGCPFHCSYCLWPQTMYREHKHRKRSPLAVVEEMECLIRRFNFKAVYFDDDVFNIDREHVLAICNEIIKKKIEIPWAAMARADLMDETLLESMSCAGLCAIKYGIESADQNIVNLCKKNMDLDKAYQAIRLTKKLGIKVHLTFCLGLQGESKQTIQQTVKFIQDSQPDSLQFSFATPFPGTEYFEYIRNKGRLLSEHWPDYDANYKCVVKTQELSNRDLERIRLALNNNFNLQ
ncbi:radical SAM protein [Patescibacteria group bacterium]|nr:radical SAM protein [Patescibacteria group bacterium]